MRLLLKLLLSAGLGFAIVAVLVVLLPMPKSGSALLPISGFFPEGEVVSLNPEQLEKQFLYANLDAQQSAIAEARLLNGVAAEYEQFLGDLDVSPQARKHISERLMQAQRELTDYRLAQSMNVLGDRQLAYAPANNYVLHSLKEILTPDQANKLQAVQRQFAWERFKSSYRARLDSFAESYRGEHTESHGEAFRETFDAALRDAIVEAQFASSYELDSPHALGLASPAQRIERQLAALSQTLTTLSLTVDSEALAAAKLFIEHEKRQLENLQPLL